LDEWLLCFRESREILSSHCQLSSHLKMRD
jgi:hypothetical protein